MIRSSAVVLILPRIFCWLDSSSFWANTKRVVTDLADFDLILIRNLSD
jgi:hypothetical protein